MLGISFEIRYGNDKKIKLIILFLTLIYIYAFPNSLLVQSAFKIILKPHQLHSSYEEHWIYTHVKAPSIDRTELSQQLAT